MAAEPEVGPRASASSLEATLSLYETELGKWWDALEALAGTMDAEAICSCVDRATEEAVARQREVDSTFDPETCDLGEVTLSDKVRTGVDMLCLRANALDDKPEAALKIWADAMRLLPADQFYLCGTTASYVLMGAGDTLHKSGKLDAALSTMRLVMFIPGTIGTPYAHFLLGAVKAEMGDVEGATVELGRALFLDEGGELFETVSEGKGKASIDPELFEMAKRGAAELQLEMERIEHEEG